MTSAGKVVLNAVKREVLERLLANLAGEPVQTLDGYGTLPPGVMPTYAGSSDTIPAAPVPVAPLWAALTVNMVVLAPEQNDQGASEGWWEAVLDAQTANAPIDEIAGAMRDALLNWPARVSGLIAADLGTDPHLVQTVLQQHITDPFTEAAQSLRPQRYQQNPSVRSASIVEMYSAARQTGIINTICARVRTKSWRDFGKPEGPARSRNIQ
ncbi:MAG: hypothetical protein NT133_25895 [Alphaproteobacteria bacterium]|nr:hypothetical protein [Alphaproteobacteria bacterium]